MPDSPHDGRSGHVVLCGLNELGFRTLEQLHRLGDDVVVVTRGADEALVEGARELGASIVEGSYRNASVLRAAGVPSASGMVITEDDDIGNLHAALAAQEMNPHLRIGLRMFNDELGRRVQTLLPHCVVLDPAAIAAPAFVSAALYEDVRQRLEVEGRTLVVRRLLRTDPDVLLPLSRAENESSPDFFPEEGDELLCLASVPAPVPMARRARSGAPMAVIRRRFVRAARTLSALVRSADRRIRLLAAIFAGLALFSSALFWLFAGLSPLDALYFTVTVITTTGFGDISMRDAHPLLQAYTVLLMLVGAASLAILFALVTDLLVGARLARALGGPTGRLRNHIVVCGLGNIGYRVVQRLIELGVPVAAVELEEESRFWRLLRRRVPVLVGDARLAETLRALRVSEARAVVVVTNDDLANLETALAARAVNPGLRVVLRLFDPDLALRVERAFGIHISRSPAALAAPAFAAAAAGGNVLTTIAVGPRALIVARATVRTGSTAVGSRVGDVERGADVRVLALIHDGRADWRPPATTMLGEGDDLVVVATRGGLARVMRSTDTPRSG